MNRSRSLGPGCRGRLLRRGIPARFHPRRHTRAAPRPRPLPQACVGHRRQDRRTRQEPLAARQPAARPSATQPAPRSTAAHPVPLARNSQARLHRILHAEPATLAANRLCCGTHHNPSVARPHIPAKVLPAGAPAVGYRFAQARSSLTADVCTDSDYAQSRRRAWDAPHRRSSAVDHHQTELTPPHDRCVSHSTHLRRTLAAKSGKCSEKVHVLKGWTSVPPVAERLQRGFSR